MALASAIYSIIFLPLISSLSCLVFRKKNISFFIAALLPASLILLLSFYLSDIFDKQSLANDFHLSIISTALEFRFDIVGVVFLSFLLFVKSFNFLFFSPDFKKLLDDKKGSVFYAVFLLQIFGIVGICTSNNLFNLFIFLEIYSLSFFALFSIFRDVNLLKLSFRYFCLNAAASILILFCFVVIYLVFGEVNFSRIHDALAIILPQHVWFLRIIFLLLAVAFFLKFFPFWVYFKVLRSNGNAISFLKSDLFFTKALIGVFLAIKFIYFFFGKDLVFNNFVSTNFLIFLAVLLVLYSAFRLYRQKHLKIISFYFGLNNLAFIFIGIFLHTVESLQASFFYLLSFVSANLLIFIFSVFLKKHFITSSIKKISSINEEHPLLLFPLKVLALFIAAFPLTSLFFANWYLAYATLNLGFEIIVIVAMVIANFAYINLVINLISAFFAATEEDMELEEEEEEEEIEIEEGEVEEIETDEEEEYDEFEEEESDARPAKFYQILFFFLAGGILASFFVANILNSLSFKFSAYLFSIS